MRSMEPKEEALIIRRNIGYFWSFSYEFGPSGDRQKTILTGNVEGMERALVEMRRAKIKLLELVAATAEELSKPPEYEGYKRKEEGPLH